MAVTALPDLAEDVIDFTVDDSGGGGGVPITRLVSTTAPYLIGGGPLSGNLTISAVQSGGGSTLVGAGRHIDSTSPIKVNNVNVAQLSGDIVISAVAFNGSADGYVVKNASGVQGKYLKDDGTWGVSAVAGVSSLIQGTGIGLSPSNGVGDVTVTAIPVSIGLAGIVPATGGADSTKFLCATLPVSWAVPGAGQFLTLQGSTPGTADIGHAHITGVFLADDIVGVGTNTPLAPLQITTGGPSSRIPPSGVGVTVMLPASMMVAFHGANSVSAPGISAIPTWMWRRSRGTEASPTGTLDGDVIGALGIQPRLAAPSGYAVGAFAHIVVADGNATTGNQKFYQDFVAGPSQYTSGVAASPEGRMRLSEGGLRIGPGANFGSSDRAKSSLDVVGSLGLRTTVKVATTNPTNYYLLDSDCVVLGDCTSGQLVFVLPVSSGREGRVYSFSKIDSSANQLLVFPQTGSGAIAGYTGGIYLNRVGDSLTIVCDGTNWWTIDNNASKVTSNLADHAAVANTAAETTAIIMGAYFGIEVYGGRVARTNVAGKFSTTGTPTLRFKIKSLGGTIIADSGAITMPSSVTDAVFQVEAEFADRTGGNTPDMRTTKALLHIAQAAGIGAAVNTYNMLDITAVSASAGSSPYNMTVQWSAASASNTLTVLEASAERLLGLLN